MSSLPVEFRVGPGLMNNVGALVLGGGRGTRLYPLTAVRAKPAVPLLGRYRLVDIPLSQCIHSGVKKIFVLTQFNSASLNRHIMKSYRFDTFSDGFVEILAAEQTLDSGDWYQGTADAVRQQLRRLRSINVSHYLVLSGDQLYRMDYRYLMKTHLETGAEITVAALPVAAEAAQGLGIMRIQRNRRIRQFVEKPAGSEELAPLVTAPNFFTRYGIKAEGRPYLASMGVYVFDVGVLEVLQSQPDWIDFGKQVIPNALKKRKVFAHLFDGFWEDIGTVRSYYDVHMRMVSRHPPFPLYDRYHIIYTHPRYLPGSRFEDVCIKNSMICEGCRISKATIADSVIGIRSVIRPGARIRRSVVMGADFFEDEQPRAASVSMGIGAGCDITRAIIDKNACIGDHVVIRGSSRLRDRDGEGYAIRDGIVIVQKNAVIPSGTRIG